MTTKDVGNRDFWIRVGWFAGVSVLLILLSLLLWKIPKRQVSNLTSLTPEQRFDRENEARKTLAQIVGGVLVLLGAYLTWRNIKNTEEAQRENNENAQKTFQLSQEGQITDRFAKAIDQLGSAKLESRLGAIYALERIARDSERDHWPIMEVLTAYVREHSSILGGPHDRKLGPLRVMAPDIQAILTVVGRRNTALEKRDQWLNLGFVYPHGADFREGNFSQAYFRGSNLTLSSLDGADLSEAELIHVDLRDASLCKVNLAKSCLGLSNLQGANLNGANLDSAKLVSADLTDAMFSGAEPTPQLRNINE